MIGDLRLTTLGWVVLWMALFGAMAAFVAWSDATWAGPRPTAEQEAAWHQ